MARAARGALHGSVATLAMTAALAVTRKLGVRGEAPPRKITRAALRALGVRPRHGAALDVMGVAAHVAFGAGAGALYEVAFARGPAPVLVRGALFGLAVWAVNYAGWIPAAGIMPPPSRDRSGRPSAMIAGHVVYGLTLAGLAARSLRR